MAGPIEFARENQSRYLEELVQFLRIPSISTLPEHADDARAAAVWLAGTMREAGLENVRVIDTQRHPLVYGDWLHAGENAPTVLVYGHYDVQPADPLDLWHSPPFEPTIKKDFLYARGSSDDKGQLLTHVYAVEAYLKNGGRLPVNVKFLIEGEEECGGESLAAFIPAHKEMLQADVALVSDTAIAGPDQPAIVYGLRGMCYMYVEITGPKHDLHSGAYGGGVNNPLNVLGHVIAGLKDQDGRVLIPGFYDKVRPLSDDERALLAKLELTEARFLDETGAPQVWGEPEFSLVERLGARPTLDVHGIIGGYTGKGAKTVLPSTGHAKISMRLVPDQDPAEIAALFERHVRSIAPPSVTVEINGRGSRASITDYTIPAMQAAAAGYAEAFGKEPVYMRSGGSIPVVQQFQEHLALETVLMGFGLPDDNLHAPNERFLLPNFYKGIETSIHFLAEYARLHAAS